MLKLPKDPSELMSLLNALARLTLGNDDFKQEFRAWLESEYDRIAKLNKERDDIVNRWNQGACQMLKDLLEYIDTSNAARQALEEKLRSTEV